MAKVCEVCGKKPITGNHVSHAKNRVRRRWLPNLQTVRAQVEGSSNLKKVKVCTSCIRAGKVVKGVKLPTPKEEKTVETVAE